MGQERKPFHESVIDSILEATAHDLIVIGTLLMRTAIPKGHDAIIAAWKENFVKRFGDAGDAGSINYVVIASLEEQKCEAAKKEEAKAAATS